MTEFQDQTPLQQLTVERWDDLIPLCSFLILFSSLTKTCMLIYLILESVSCYEEQHENLETIYLREILHLYNNPNDLTSASVRQNSRAPNYDDDLFISPEPHSTRDSLISKTDESTEYHIIDYSKTEALRQCRLDRAKSRLNLVI